MKDNIEFYVEFIAEIEKNPVLYNHTLAEYSNRRISEIVWTKIKKDGEKFNERGKLNIPIPCNYFAMALIRMVL